MRRIIRARFPDRIYKIVYADPSWNYYGDPNKDAACGKHYDTMTLEEICLLPIKSIMDKKSALFLWATCPKLHYAFEAIKAWDLYYRGVAFIWAKCRRDGKLIHGQGPRPTFTHPTSELVLVATPNKYGRPFKILDESMGQVIVAPRTRKHSEKPPIFRDKIVELCGDLPRIELFAREKFDGWDGWGKEYKP